MDLMSNCGKSVSGNFVVIGSLSTLCGVHAATATGVIAPPPTRAVGNEDRFVAIRSNPACFWRHLVRSYLIVLPKQCTLLQSSAQDL